MTEQSAALVARLRELLEKASPPPWTAVSRCAGWDNANPDRDGDFLGWEIEGPEHAWARGWFDRGIDAHLAAAAVNALPQLLALAEEAEALRAFKTWVHDYLDTHGVPHHPPGTHGAEGCRIGDRLDWLLERAALKGETL